MAGRPTLLDDEKRRTAVLEAFLAGASFWRAAQAGGVHKDTLRLYLSACAEDTETDPVKIRFPVAVEEAKAAGHLVNLARLDDLTTNADTSMAKLKALEMLLRMSGDLQGPGGPSVAIDLGEDGRPTRIRASIGADLVEMTDDEIAAELAGGEK